MMGVVLVMTLHVCYAVYKQRMDTALPPPIKPVASRVPLVRSTAETPTAIEIKPIEMDIKPTWGERPYKCRS